MAFIHAPILLNFRAAAVVFFSAAVNPCNLSPVAAQFIFVAKICPAFPARSQIPLNTLKHLKNCCLSRSGGGESSAKAKNECVQPVSDIAVHLDKSAEPKLILAKVKNETPIKSNASSMSPGNPKTELPGHSPAAGTKQSSAGTILARAQICPTFV